MWKICLMQEMRGQEWLLGHGRAHSKVSQLRHQINQKDGVLGDPFVLNPSPSVIGRDFHKELSPSPSPPGSKLSPSILLIIVILSVLFVISCLLHLLVRCLTKTPSSNRNSDASSTDSLQRQLQQLFHLQDSGLDQASIDALPVFTYKEVSGPKEPFDCAVCLGEFSGMDQLRLLPMCGHAFHINCIDTWLLSNSTCPLCRGALVNPGFSIENPVFSYDDFWGGDGCPKYVENGFTIARKRLEIEEVARQKGVFPVRLGKFRKLDATQDGEVQGETSCSKLDARRCYSMGSYQYVVGNAELRVPLREDPASELVKGGEQSCNALPDGSTDGKKVGISTKTDSYSVSKIWLWSKKGKFADAALGKSSSTDLDSLWMHRTQGI